MEKIGNMPYIKSSDKAKHNEEYYRQRREEIAERKRQWYQANKDRIVARQRRQRREDRKQDKLAALTKATKLLAKEKHNS